MPRKQRSSSSSKGARERQQQCHAAVTQTCCCQIPRLRTDWAAWTFQNRTRFSRAHLEPLGLAQDLGEQDAGHSSHGPPAVGLLRLSVPLRQAGQRGRRREHTSGCCATQPCLGWAGGPHLRSSSDAPPLLQLVEKRSNRHCRCQQQAAAAASHRLRLAPSGGRHRHPGPGGLQAGRRACRVGWAR